MANVILDSVWKIYNEGQDEAVIAVKNANLHIPDGEFVALLGPSGCGKTSILRMIAGLEHISRGTIAIGDQIVNSLSSDERNIAMAFETYALYPHFTVYENLAFCLRAKGQPKDELKTRVDRILTALHLEDIQNSKPSDLPGGQKQMVSVARAMVREPNVFLLDEIFSHIDASMRVDARATIKMLVNETKTTSILVTHDQHEAIAMADRVVVMNFAEIQQYAHSRDLIHKPVNLFVANFVGEPAINLMKCDLSRDNGNITLIGTDTDAKFVIGDAVAKDIEASGLMDVIVGIRPQEFTIVPLDQAQIKGTVSLYEYLGENSNLMIDSGTNQITIVVNPQMKASVGENIGLAAPSSKVMIFDPNSEMAISHGIV
jgi:multiple sugar transport system ATP-binding protein